MGNRAFVIFYDRSEVSPAIYLHWHRDEVPSWLAELKLLMKGRENDAEYAAARFTGICHGRIEGNLGLGIRSYYLKYKDVISHEQMSKKKYSDSIVIVVDTADFSWRAYGGEMAKPKED